MAMDCEWCQQIKCGIIPQSSVSMEDLYACSAECGAGALYPCHTDCLRFGKCAQPLNLPLPLSALPTTQALINHEPHPYIPEPLLYADVIQPIPDVVAMAVPLVTCPPPCCGMFDDLNAGINENPFMALLGLAVVIGAVAIVRKG